MHLSDNQKRGVLAVLADVLAYARAFVSVSGPTDAGLAREHCSELNRLLNIVHNVPRFIEGTYVLGFDEDWFVKALQAFDTRNGTAFASTYVQTSAPTSISNTAQQHGRGTASIARSSTADLERLDPESEACFVPLKMRVAEELAARVAAGDDPSTDEGREALSALIADAVLDLFAVRERTAPRYRWAAK